MPRGQTEQAASSETDVVPAGHASQARRRGKKPAGQTGGPAATTGRAGNGRGGIVIGGIVIGGIVGRGGN